MAHQQRLILHTSVLQQHRDAPGGADIHLAADLAHPQHDALDPGRFALGLFQFLALARGLDRQGDAVLVPVADGTLALGEGLQGRVEPGIGLDHGLALEAQARDVGPTCENARVHAQTGSQEKMSPERSRG